MIVYIEYAEIYKEMRISMNINVILSIQHNIYRSCLKKVLEKYDNICIAGETCFFDDVESLLTENNCDVIITDMYVKNKLYIDVMKDISLDNRIGVILLVSSNDIKNLKAVPDKHYNAVIALSSDVNKLVRAIHIVNNKEKYIDESLDLSDKINVDKKLGLLTNREREVLGFIAQGCFNKEIASKMGIAERTVKNHVSNIFKKIDVCDRTQAAIYAIRNNIVNL